MLDKSYKTAHGETRYVQFGDECATLDEAKKLARFPNLHEPIFVRAARRLPLCFPGIELG